MSSSTKSQAYVFPLSFAQQRLWFLDQFMEEGPVYNMPVALHLRGELDTAVLENAFNEIVRRHEILRTRFAKKDGQPVQIIDKDLRLPLPVVDLQTFPEGDRLNQAQKLAKTEAQRPFSLIHGPLLRVTLLKLGLNEHVLLVTIHHIVADAWSIGIMIQEVVALYNAFRHAQPSPLTELPLQYADFAHWQREWLKGETFTEQLNFWKQQLKGAPEVLNLPFDRPRPAIASFCGSSQTFPLDAALTKELNRLAQQNGVTLFMTLLGAFTVLLSRYSQQQDVMIGSPVANRNRTEIERLIGFFVNTLVLRADLTDDPNFLEVLTRVKKMCLGAYAHTDIPFEHLVDVLNPQRNTSHHPLFQVMFTLQKVPVRNMRISGLDIDVLEHKSSIAKFDLTLFIEESEGELRGSFEYNMDLFDSSTIKRMTANFITLLEGIVADPKRKVSELPLLSQKERQQLLMEGKQSERSEHCLHQIIESQAQKTPHATALEFQGECLTYEELNGRSNQLAHYLKTLGVKEEVLVGVCMERSLEMVIALLAILKAGGAFVPMDPSYPKERLAFILRDSRAAVLLTQERLCTRLPSYKDDLRTICLDSQWESIAQESQANPETKMNSGHLAYVIYTSGSTGQPKGVQIPHRSVVNFLSSMQQSPGMTEDDVLLAVTTISFDIAALELFLPLITGAKILLASQDVAVDGRRLKKYLAKATVMQATPSTWRMLLTAGWKGSPHLKVLCGGEALGKELADQLRQRCDALWNMYGPTETTIWSSIYNVPKVQDYHRDHKGINDTYVSIGRPIADTQFYVLDRQQQLLPIGVPGELYIGGAGLARGYLNRPELTAAKFIPDPFSEQSGARLYRTGDLVRYLPDGNIEFLGRLDHQVKVRGFRIELGEIEATLQQHPGIREAVVTPRRDEVDQQLVAYMVFSNGKLIVEELRGYLKEKLPPYMIPASFVSLEKMPLTPNGKVDRKALPAPDGQRPTLKTDYVAAGSPLEKKLAKIWMDVLCLDKIGIHDNFFDLGGHSLLLVQLLDKVKKETQREVPMLMLFQDPTISGMASLLKSERLTLEDGESMDLAKEAVLDEHIRAKGRVHFEHVSMKKVLLTGSTGFVGAFLLNELLEKTSADIYCLVRAKDLMDAKSRINENLKQYHLWKGEHGGRIIPVLGDLSKSDLGLEKEEFAQLAQEMDVVYHNGARVSFASPYEVMKETNVRSTEEILKLASRAKCIPVHYISTSSIFPNPQSQYREESPIDQLKHFAARGYVTSKWVSEKLVMLAQQRGMPCRIYRLGHITGHSRTGACKPEHYLLRLLIGCAQLGYFPQEIGDAEIDATPVDYVASSIVYLSRQPLSEGQVFHLVNPHHSSYQKIFQELKAYGRTICPLPYEEWFDKVNHFNQDHLNSPFYPIMPIINGLKLVMQTLPKGKVLRKQIISRMDYKIGCSHTIKILSDGNIHCPKPDRDLFNSSFSFLEKKQLIKRDHVHEECPAAKN